MNEANSTLSYGPDCVALTKSSESCRLTAYKDTGGVWTIGWGWTHGVKAGDTCTQEQADDWLYEELDDAWQSVYSFVDVPLKQGHADALTDFVYNLGPTQFRQSTLLRKLNAGDYTGCAAQFSRWVYDNGKKLNGLVARREAERKLFTGETT